MIYAKTITIPTFKKLSAHEQESVKYKIFVFIESLLSKGVHLVYAEKIAAKELMISHALIIEVTSSKRIKELSAKYFPKRIS